MFSLQRVIDNIRRKQWEHRVASQKKCERIKEVENIYCNIDIYGRRIDMLAGIFSHTSLGQLETAMPDRKSRYAVKSAECEKRASYPVTRLTGQGG